MDGHSRLPGFYPETPAAMPSSSRYGPSTNGHSNSPQNHGSIGRAGGPIRRTPITRSRAYSTPYARPPPQNTPGSGNRSRIEEDDEEARVKKTFSDRTAELVGTLVSGVKDWFSSSKTPRREHVQSVVPRKKTPQRSLTSRMEEGFDKEIQQQQQPQRESENMFSPSLAPHYAGHTPWIVKQRKGVLSQEPPIFPLPNTNPGHHRQDLQSKYATLPAKRSNILEPHIPNKRIRQRESSSSLRPLKEWELSKDRFAEQDQDTLEWCDKYGIDIVALASGLQKRPPLPSFADIQRYDALRNDVAFFERQGIRHLPRRTKKQSSIRHATSSYELSRIAQENSAIYNTATSIDPTDSSSSKLHAWRELVRLKESKAKTDRENAQLERSKQRNGYSSRSISRSSSRVRGPAGEVSDDVWVLPSLRPGSSGSRMRTASPAGSFRSQQGGRSRPRGRDIFDEGMVDEGVQTAPLLLVAPASDTASMKDVDEISPPRKKRPGYFSAREEDLDPLEMDVDDFITPARKKQRTSISLHQGPKFAALWEPSRRENWPLGEMDENTKTAQEEKKDVKERERVKEELKDLESPAFKLPPSARKEVNLMDMEQSSPTKAVEKDSGDLKFQFSKTRPPKSDSNDFKLPISMAPASPTKATENGTQSTTFSFSKPPPSPTKPTADTNIPKFQLPLPTTSAGLFSQEKSVSKPTTTEEPKPNGSPSKTSSFMQSILSEKTRAESMEGIPSTTEKRTENGVKSPGAESQPSSQFQFSANPTQSTFGGFSAVHGGFKFGGDTGFSGFGVSTSKPAPSSPLKEPAKVTSPPVEKPAFNFGLPKKTLEEPHEGKAVEKPVETKPAPQFNFDQPKTESSAPSLFGNVTAEAKNEAPTLPVFNTNAPAEPKKETAPMFGSLGPFGGAFNKSETKNSKPLFRASSPSVASGRPLFGSGAPAPSIPPPPNSTGNEPENAPATATAAAPVFGSGFKFTSSTTPASAEAPKKEVTPPPVVPATAVPQDLDDSMDITDSPPTSRNASMPGDTLPQFPLFPTSAPTSAPNTTVELPKPLFNFSQASSTADKPALPKFNFNAVEEKTGFSAPIFGAPTNPPFGSPSPVPSAPAFSGFGAFPKKEENAQDSQKPADKPFTFLPSANPAAPLFGAAPPTEQKPLFGSQTTAPVFGSNTPSIFGNAPAFPSNPQSSMTSPPAAAASPPSSSFNFNFTAPAPTAPQPFGTSNTSFFPQNPPLNNPFAPAPAVPSTAGFPVGSSAPVSPQNPQLTSFPGTSGAPNQFGSQTAGLFGAGTTQSSTTNFPNFAQNVPAAPIFTLGADMQRSSSDGGPSNSSPSSRKFAQPGRRRLTRRG